MKSLLLPDNNILYEGILLVDFISSCNTQTYYSTLKQNTSSFTCCFLWEKKYKKTWCSGKVFSATQVNGGLLLVLIARISSVATLNGYDSTGTWNQEKLISSFMQTSHPKCEEWHGLVELIFIKKKSWNISCQQLRRKKVWQGTWPWMWIWRKLKNKYADCWKCSKQEFAVQRLRMDQEKSDKIV